MAHGTQIVDFIGLDGRNDRDQIAGVAQIAVMQEELYLRVVTITVKMINTTRVEARRPTDNTVYLTSTTRRVRKMNQQDKNELRIL